MTNKNNPLVAMAKDKDVDLRDLKNYEADINNHPLIIMADERKVDLLQHPLCMEITLRKWRMYGRNFYFFQLFVNIIFLLGLNFFILSSDSPLDSPERFNCTGDAFERIAAANSEEHKTNRLAHFNPYARVLLLVSIAARVVFFFINREIKSLLSQLRNIRWSHPNLPTVFLFEFLVYTLALFVATSASSCFYWQVSAVAISLAWINLLFNLRLLYGIGQYIVLFQDVIFTFCAVAVVFIIMVTGFAFSFHILLSNRQEFQTPYDAMLKTLMMMSGEMDYVSIFFKDNPPLGWGNDWDQDWEKVPFPFITYGMFLVFFFLVSIVALNVLVGLTVDDIRNFLENADLVKLTMRLKFSLRRQWLLGKWEDKEDLITKQLNLEASATSDLVARYQTATSDLISKVRIWEKIEKKQEEIRRKSEAEQEKRNMTDLNRNFQDVLRIEINDQTTKLKSEMNRGRRGGRQGLLEENKFGELFSNIESLTSNVESLTSNMESLITQMKEQKTEIESMKKMIMKGSSDVE